MKYFFDFNCINGNNAANIVFITLTAALTAAFLCLLCENGTCLLECPKMQKSHPKKQRGLTLGLTFCAKKTPQKIGLFPY